MTNEMTPEQEQAAKEQAARNETLLAQVVQAATMAERTAAARELAFMPPAASAGQDQPVQTRLVLRMVRTPDGKFWGAIEGANGVVSQIVLTAAGDMVMVMGSAASLVCCPLMTDEEHAAYLKQIADAAVQNG